eukprot:g8583.t1
MAPSSTSPGEAFCPPPRHLDDDATDTVAADAGGVLAFGAEGEFAGELVAAGAASTVTDAEAVGEQEHFLKKGAPKAKPPVTSLPAWLLAAQSGVKGFQQIRQDTADRLKVLATDLDSLNRAAAVARSTNIKPRGGSGAVTLDGSCTSAVASGETNDHDALALKDDGSGTNRTTFLERDLVPEEVWLLCFQYLDGKEVGRMRGVCVAWKMWIDCGEELWREIFCRDFFRLQENVGQDSFVEDVFPSQNKIGGILVSAGLKTGAGGTGSGGALKSKEAISVAVDFTQMIHHPELFGYLHLNPRHYIFHEVDVDPGRGREATSSYQARASVNLQLICNAPELEYLTAVLDVISTLQGLCGYLGFTDAAKEWNLGANMYLAHCSVLVEGPLDEGKRGEDEKPHIMEREAGMKVACSDEDKQEGEDAPREKEITLNRQHQQAQAARVSLLERFSESQLVFQLARLPAQEYALLPFLAAKTIGLAASQRSANETLAREGLTVGSRFQFPFSSQARDPNFLCTRSRDPELLPGFLLHGTRLYSDGRVAGEIAAELPEDQRALEKVQSTRFRMIDSELGLLYGSFDSLLGVLLVYRTADSFQEWMRMELKQEGNLLYGFWQPQNPVVLVQVAADKYGADYL